MRGNTEDIKYALGDKKPDLVLKNARVLNVFTKEFIQGDVAIRENRIIGIGRFNGVKELDCFDKYVVPLFIDGHVHIESSMMTPGIFSYEILKNGVGTAIADPHEIANVTGESGVEFMIKDAENSGADIFFMVPSCVPSTKFDDNGAVLGLKELRKLKEFDSVLGLGEVMDVSSVIGMNDLMMEKLRLFKDCVIDGHCPDISRRSLNAYVAAGINTDHESSTAKEALMKVEAGLDILVRESSAAKDLKKVLPAVDKKNFHKFCFCTDDRHIDDILKEGTINHCVRKAMQLGMRPADAYTMGSYNAAKIYGLDDRGAVAPGYKADLLVVNNLEEVGIEKVIKNGLVFEDKGTISDRNYYFENTMKLESVSVDMLKVQAEGEVINVIKLIPNSIITKKEVKGIIEEDGYVKGIKGRRINKIAVFGRHRKNAPYSVGYIDGFGIKNCAIAQSISHDSHNIVCVGDNDEDMCIAINKIIQMGGGVVLASEGVIMESIALPIAGLMTSMSADFISSRITKIKEILWGKGLARGIDPMITTSFTSLTVIPSIKLTARGLYDYTVNDFIPLFIK